MSTGGRPSMPGRHFVLMEADQQAYVAQLRTAFPDIGFLPSGHDFRYSKPPPPAELQPTMANMHPRAFCTVSFTPGWRPELTTNSDGSLGVTDPPRPNASIQRGGWISEAGERNGTLWPPKIEGGHIYFRCEKGNAAHMSLARKGLRLLTNVATNKVAFVHYPSLRVKDGSGKGVMVWCGFHALEWCREAPDRFLAYGPLLNGREGYGYRPLD
jgi:hypothetical protein